MLTVKNAKQVASGVAVTAGLFLTMFIVGCGNSGSDVSSIPSPPTVPNQTANGAAPTAPAIDVKLTLDKLSLDSPINRVKDSNGLVFLHFKYTDNDGKVYMCVMPEALSKDSKTPADWLNTFGIYKEPIVLAQKHVKKVKSNENENLTGFPFIAPKPSAPVNTSNSPAAAPAPAQSPTPPLPGR